MKAIEAIQIILVLAFGFILYMLFKARKFKQADDAIYEKELTADPINKVTLQDYGFKVYETKDKLYALHPNGASMTQVEGPEWSVEIRGTKGGWHKNVNTIGELTEFCEDHDKPIKKQEEH